MQAKSALFNKLKGQKDYVMWQNALRKNDVTKGIMCKNDKSHENPKATKSLMEYNALNTYDKMSTVQDWQNVFFPS